MCLRTNYGESGPGARSILAFGPCVLADLARLLPAQIRTDNAGSLTCSNIHGRAGTGQ